MPNVDPKVSSPIVRDLDSMRAIPSTSRLGQGFRVYVDPDGSGNWVACEVVESKADGSLQAKAEGSGKVTCLHTDEELGVWVGSQAILRPVFFGLAEGADEEKVLRDVRSFEGVEYVYPDRAHQRYGAASFASERVAERMGQTPEIAWVLPWIPDTQGLYKIRQRSQSVGVYGDMITQTDLKTKGYELLPGPAQSEYCVGVWRKWVCRGDVRLYAIKVHVYRLPQITPERYWIEISTRLHFANHRDMEIFPCLRSEDTIEDVEAFVLESYLRLGCVPDWNSQNDP